jgi:hypothetical protein
MDAKRHRMPRRLIITLALAVPGAVVQCNNAGVTTSKSKASTSTSLTAPLPSTHEYGLNELAIRGSFEIRMVSQRKCSVAVPAPTRTGNRIWAAELEISNVSKGPISVNPFFLTLKDERKNTYVTNLNGCPPILESQMLLPGARARGFVPFEIPEFVQAATLTYRPVLSSDIDESTRFFVEL